MKNLSLKKLVIIVVLAFIPSVAIVRSHSMDNVPFCIQTAGCTFNNQPHGQVIERQYGYPLNYKKTSVFKPANNNQNEQNYAGYAEAITEQQKLNILNIMLNAVFWFAVLKLATDLLPLKKAKKVES